MRLLFVGDVVGKSGSDFFAEKIHSVKQEYGADIVIVNGENSAQGNGITKASADFLFRSGADVITTGNHAFKRREAAEMFDENPFLLRPANYPEGCVGKGWCVLDLGACRLAVVNLMGVVYMEALDNPFSVMDHILEELSSEGIRNIFVDFHAEATAEKKAMGHYLTGKVTALIGTHTHVQTADECILGGHTAYLTDAGMTGPESSVLGVDIEPAVNKQRFHFPVQFREAQGPCFLNGVFLEFDEKLGISTKIDRLIIR